MMRTADPAPPMVQGCRIERTFYEKRQQAVRDTCQRRGIRIEQTGRGFRLIGFGVDMTVVDLAAVDPRDLKPALD